MDRVCIGVSIALPILVLFYIVLAYKKLPKKRQDSVANLLICLVGTFVGVFAAVYLTNSVDVATEKSELIASMRFAQKEIEVAGEDVITWRLWHTNHLADGQEEALRHLNSNPFPPMLSVDRLLLNPEIQKYASQGTIEDLICSREDLRAIILSINDQRTAVDERAESIEGYGRELRFVDELLRAEEQHIQGELSLSELSFLRESLREDRMTEEGDWRAPM